MLPATTRAGASQGNPEKGIGARRRRRKASPHPLETTYSRAEVMEHLGIGKDKLHELVILGRKWEGCHPTKGGLHPVHRVSHKCLRIPQGAIQRHLEHMDRLHNDAMFAASMRCRARGPLRRAQ